MNDRMLAARLLQVGDHLADGAEVLSVRMMDGYVRLVIKKPLEPQRAFNLMPNWPLRVFSPAP